MLKSESMPSKAQGRPRRQKKGADEAVRVTSSTEEEDAGATGQCASTRHEVEELVKGLCFVPQAFVFDLDDTLWEGDVDRCGGPPFTVEDGETRRLHSKAGSGLALFPDVVDIFNWLEASELRGAIASHTGEAPWAESALQALKTAGGKTFSAVAPVKQMFRADAVAQRSKAVHLQRIADKLGCDPREMVFFDNMEHNVLDGESIDVTSVFTPDGLNWSSMATSLVEFDRRALERAAAGVG